LIRPVFFLPPAEAELLEAQAWYDGRRFGLGDRFFAAVDDLVVRIGAAPHQFPSVHPGTHRALVPSFPYALYFRTEPHEVFVIACAHTSRHSSLWQRRT